MKAHVIDTLTQIGMNTIGESTAQVRYRWRCSCGAEGKRWNSSQPNGPSAGAAARRARNGGARHVAAQERGR